MSKALRDCDGDTRGWRRHGGTVRVPRRAIHKTRLIDVIFNDQHPTMPGWTVRRLQPERPDWRQVSHWRLSQ